MKNYSKKPYIILSAVASLVLIAGAIFYSGNKKNKRSAEKFINPPLADTRIKNVSYSIDAASGGEIVTKDGTKISIPSDAFMDKNGENISGKVDITYRGFHDQADIFLSGIPMDYDSGGTKYVFTSAGMVDINGYSKGDPVFIKEGKKLEVAMLSESSDTKYNLYQLDTINKKWLCQGKDKIAKIDSSDRGADKTISASDSKNEKLETPINETNKTLPLSAKIPAKPVEPQIAQNGKLKIHLDVNPEEFPELALYKNTVFEVQEDEIKEASSDKITWTDAVLSASNQEGVYILKLESSSLNITYHVKPVFEGQNLAAAKKEYKKKFAEYLAVKADYEKREAENMAVTMEKSRIAFKKRKQDEYESIKKRDSLNFANTNNRAKVLRIFSIFSFGVWNSDCADPYPHGANIENAIYKSKNGDDISIVRVYLIPNKNITMFELPQTNSFDYDPKQEAMLLVISRDNHIHIYPSDEFAKIPANTKEFTFYMKEPEGKLATVEDVKKFMGI